MKVVAYSIKPFEKGSLVKANTKKHDITLISNALSVETAIYAEGKEAVIVFTDDDVSETVINILAGYGIKYITTRSVGIGHIDKMAAAKYGIELANVRMYLSQAPEHSYRPHRTLLSKGSLQQIADQTILNLDQWQHLKKKIKSV